MYCRSRGLRQTETTVVSSNRFVSACLHSRQSCFFASCQGYTLYSVLKIHSLTKDKWLPEIKHHCPDTKFILVGLDTENRDDAEYLDSLKQRMITPISREQGKKVARELGALGYFECSAAT